MPRRQQNWQIVDLNSEIPDFCAARRRHRSPVLKVVDNHSHLQSNEVIDLRFRAMYVCICNAVTDKMIRAAAAAGAKSLDDLARMTGCAGGCGSCAELAEEMLHAVRKPQPLALNVFAQAA
jgi:bacterioferritin-associated ferredoxin